MTPSEDAWIAREYAKGQMQVEISRELGLSQAYVCISIERFCASLGYYVKFKYYGPHRAAMARHALACYQGEFTRPTNTRNPTLERLHDEARREHAWLLRAEGLTLREIGRRLGVSHERVRQILYQFGRRVQRAIRKTRFKIVEEVRDELE
jgi:hypothetical protein